MNAHTQLVTVLGPAGVGKSRLLREFLTRAGEEVGHSADAASPMETASLLAAC